MWDQGFDYHPQSDDSQIYICSSNLTFIPESYLPSQLLPRDTHMSIELAPLIPLSK